MNEKLGEVFIDGRIINLDNSEIDVLEEALKKLREQRVEKINTIAQNVRNLQA